MCWREVKTEPSLTVGLMSRRSIQATKRKRAAEQVSEARLSTPAEQNQLFPDTAPLPAPTTRSCFEPPKLNPINSATPPLSSVLTAVFLALSLRDCSCAVVLALTFPSLRMDNSPVCSLNLI